MTRSSGKRPDNLKELCRGRWRAILPQLGVDTKLLTGKQQPCPACGGKTRFRFTDREHDGLFYCNHCGVGDGFSLLGLVHGWDRRQAFKEVRRIVGNIDYKFDLPQPDEVEQLEKRKRNLNKIRGELVPFHGTPVEAYLKFRGLPANFDPRVIRCHPAMPYWEDGKKVGEYPAMVALVEDIKGRPVTYHVTYLDKAGRKADVSSPKKILPPIGTIVGAAIRLYPDNGNGSLGICEGIETGLASFVKLGHGCPIWACMSASGMEKVEIPEGIARVNIYADNDRSYTGQRAAYNKAYDLTQTHNKTVEVFIPMQPGTDWCDAMAHHRSA